MDTINRLTLCNRACWIVH